MIVDSHCHLDYPELFDELDNVLKRAEANDVRLLLTICTTLKSFDKIKMIVKKYKNIYGTFGIHPHETKDYTNINVEYISNKIRDNKKIIGIGETGLDYYYNHSDKKIQKKSFEEHIHAASQLNVPVIVHSRNAETDTYETLKNLKKNSNLKILIHCFTGSKSFAKKLLDLNCYISISGIVTFKKSTELVDAVSYIPIEKLLVETDSPYLSPEPYRGKPNEPSYVKYVVEKLALIKKIPVNSVIENTSKNFLSIFNIN